MWRALIRVVRVVIIANVVVVDVVCNLIVLEV